MNEFLYGMGLGVMTIVSAFAAPAAQAEVEAELQVDSPKPFYGIPRALAQPALSGNWSGPVWKDVPALKISHFYASDLSSHRPETKAKVVYDDKGVYVHFRVEDRYVRAIETKYHGKVWEDACVEFFVQPRTDRGYFNFEINSGGTLLLSYKENPEWKGTALKQSGPVLWELAKKVKIYHSMPKTVEPEIEASTTWQIEYFIPFEVFEAYLGKLGEVGGQTWRANFYKCAENNSHPHWASWSLITGGLNFHQPEYFSEIHFAE